MAQQERRASTKHPVSTQLGRTDTARPSRVLRVVATRLGYYGHERKREGDVFTLDAEEHFTKKWMEWADPSTPEHTTTGAQALRKDHARIREEKSRNGFTAPPDNPPDGPDPLGIDD